MNMEAHMFAVTESAASNLTAYLTQNRITSPIRVALMQGVCFTDPYQGEVLAKFAKDKLAGKHMHGASTQGLCKRGMSDDEDFVHGQESLAHPELAVAELAEYSNI